jgi:hypothetical protein
MCVEFQKGRMTIQEAKNNLRELYLIQEQMTPEEELHLDDLFWAEDLAIEFSKYKDNNED